MQLPDLLVSKQELSRAGFEARGPLRVGRVLAEASVSGVLASSGVGLAEVQAGSVTRRCQRAEHVLTFEHLRPGVSGWLSSWLGSSHCLWTLWLRLATLVKIMMLCMDYGKHVIIMFGQCQMSNGLWR